MFRSLFTNKTLWLTLAILLVVAGGIVTVSVLGQGPDTNANNTVNMAEQTTTAPPEPTTVTAPETTVAPPPVITPDPEKELAANLHVVNIAAAKDSGYGIATDSEFVLTGLEKLEDLTAITLERHISIEPDYEFSLMKNDKGEYVLKLDDPMPKNELVRIKLLDVNGNPVKAWAFQTEAELRVTNAFPSQHARVDLLQGVEVSFSAQNITTEEFAAHFDIYPEVKGTFTKNGNSFIFAPQEQYKPGTTYSVTIKAGMESEAGKTLNEDYIFGFSTRRDAGPAESTYYLPDSNISETFLPGDTMLIPIGGIDGYADIDFGIRIFRYDDIDRYLDDMYTEAENYYAKPIDVGKFGEAAAEFEVKPTIALNGYSAYLIFPESLPEGVYLAQVAAPAIDANRKPTTTVHYEYKFIQVSSLSVGIAGSDSDMLLWLNDTAENKAAANASVTLSDNKATVYAKADAQGVAITSFIDNAIEPNYYAPIKLKIEHNGKQYADVLHLYGKSDIKAYDYYTYLYTDRAIYHTTDTVNIFGMMLPRQKTSLPDKLYAVMYANNSEIQRVPLAPNDNGSFLTSFSYEDYDSDKYSYTLCLEDGAGNIYNRQYLYLREYENPLYTITANTDRLFYELDGKETVNGEITVNVSFFDGTPAAGIALQMGMYGNGSEVDHDIYATTDERGNAVFKFKINNYNGSITSSPRFVYYDIHNADDSLENNFWYNGTTRAFYRSAVTDFALSEDGRTATVKINALDTSDIKTVNDIDNKNIYTGEKLSGNTAHLTLTKRWYEKFENGSYYDFIRKQTVIRYGYRQHEEAVTHLVAEAKDGIAVFAGLDEFIKDDNAQYSLEGYIEDQNGYYIQLHAFCGTNEFIEDNSTYRRFNLINSTDDLYSSYFYDGDSISLKLHEAGNTIDKGSYLAVCVANGYSGYSVQSHDTAYEIAFNEDILPSFEVAGFYYDGRYIYELNEHYCYYLPDKRELDIAISADAERYAPGSEIKLELTATTPDGKPAANTEILVSLVDEAAFAVADKAANILREIYSLQHNPVNQLYTSYRQHDVLYGDMDTAEGGGEGESSYIRSDFVDTACFRTVTTDKEGKAALTIAMPDNITTWRITAQGYNKALQAGSEISQTVVTAEFFINPIFSSTYIEGDKAGISLRGFGNAINLEDTVSYKVQLSGNNEDKEFTVEAKAGDYAFVELGELKKGSYTLTVFANCGELSDAVQYPIECIASGINVELTKNFDLSEGIDIDPGKYPVLLRFNNASFKEYNQLLDYLLANAGFERSEQQLARSYAASVIDPEGMLLASDSSWTQPYARGVVLFNKSNSERDYNVLVSALAAIAVPEQLDTEGLAIYLNDVVNDYAASAADVAAAYMGLAALDKPVLLDIRYLLNGGWLEYDDALKLLAGLALLGDTEYAKDLYQSMISDKVNYTDDAVRGKLGYIPYENTEAEDAAYYIQSRTAMALIIANAMNDSATADALAAYLQSIRPDRYLYLLELVYHAKNMQPKDAVDASFSYVLNGETKEVTLGQFDSFTLAFSEEQLAAADFKVLAGEVNCTAVYEGSPAYLEDASKELIAIDKKITPVKGDGGPGTIYQVTLSVKFDKNAPYGAYYINDYIPSGCRYVGLADRKYRENWYLNDQSLQNISFYYPNIDPNAGISIYGGSVVTQMTTVRYYIRSILPGSYITNSAFISNSTTGIWGKAAQGTLEIIK